ncbi:MAG: DUF493 domain-containing protein [Thiohalomonadaceae bacterium]|jgi:putative lipoic acid-binding regulatory protein
MNTTDTPLEFPCTVAIKAMGLDQEDFPALVTAIISQHIAPLDANAISTRPSRNGKYISVTVTVYATEKSQLDAIYAALSADKRVVMAL